VSQSGYGPEPELSSNIVIEAGAMAIWEVAPAPGPFLDPTVLPTIFTRVLYSTLNTIVTSYDTRLQQWICNL